jgi:hypothetical protein
MFVDEVDIQLNMLGATIKNGIGREVNSRDIIAEHHGLINRTRELRKELTKSGALNNCIG